MDKCVCVGGVCVCVAAGMTGLPFWLILAVMGIMGHSINQEQASNHNRSESQWKQRSEGLEVRSDHTHRPAERCDERYDFPCPKCGSEIHMTLVRPGAWHCPGECGSCRYKIRSRDIPSPSARHPFASKPHRSAAKPVYARQPIERRDKRYDFPCPKCGSEIDVTLDKRQLWHCPIECGHCLHKMRSIPRRPQRNEHVATLQN